MSVADEILRLQQAKSDLATSIANKGVTVPAATTLDGYAALVDNIQTGGTLPYDAEIEYLGIRQNVWTEPSDYVPTGNGITIDMVARFLGYPTEKSYEIWFVARPSSTYAAYRLCRNNSNSALNFSNANTDANAGYINYTVAYNTLYYIHLDFKYFEITPVNGTTSVGTVGTTHTGTTNTNGFQLGDHGIGRGINLDVYSFTVRNYGTVVLDYIPVRVGQVGYMYDKVRKKLYGKAATCTTDFVVGADKN